MILKKKINKDYIYLISDIHANINLFKESIKELDFNEDILFILGDIFEKGNKNIETIDFVKELMDKYPLNVFSIIGNNDQVLNEFKPPRNFERLKRYSLVLGNTILNEFLEGIGVDIYSNYDLDEKLDLVLVKYKKYFDFINSLPNGYFINDKILLTHANKEESENKKIIKSDLFLKFNYQLNVVGHIPNMMLKNIPSMDPIVKDRVLYIDGGNNVVEFGGLNLVKLNLNDLSYTFKTYYNYPLYKVINNQEESGDSYIPYKREIDNLVLIDDIYKVYINNYSYYTTKRNILDNKYVYDALNIFKELKKDEIVYVPFFGKTISIIIKDNCASLAYSKNLIKYDKC